MKKSTSGFTIVELLIVIVVIGILAAITTVAYNGIQQKAQNAKLLSAFDTYEKALRIYKAQNGTYPDVPRGFHCLGSGYATTELFEENECGSMRVNGAAGLSIRTFYDTNPGALRINDALATVISSPPNLNTPAFSESLTQDGETIQEAFRGIIYARFDAEGISTGLVDGDYGIAYFIKNDQTCGRGIKKTTPLGSGGQTATVCSLALD